MKTQRPSRFTVPLCLLCLAGSLVHAAPLGTAFTYQGRLSHGGGDAHGNYDVRFGLFSVGAGGVASATVTNLNLAVANGLFTATLDFGAVVFTGTAYWLEVSVRTNGGDAFTPLAPRQALSPSPYSIYAATAGLADGAITSAKIADGGIATADFASGVVTGPVLADNSITSAKIVDGAVSANDLAADSVNASKISDGSIGTLDLALGAVTSSRILDASITGADVADNAIGSTQLADSIDLGNTAVSGTVNVFRTAANTPAISLFGSTSQISTYGSDGQEQTRLAGQTFGYLSLFDSSPANQLAALLSANGTTGGYLSLNNSNASPRAYLAGHNSGGYLYLYQADGDLGAVVDGESSGAGLVALRNTNTVTSVSLYGHGPTAGSGELALNTRLGTNTVELTSQASGSTGGRMQLKRTDGTLSVSLEAEESSGYGSRLLLYNRNGNLRAEMDADYGDNAGAISLYSADGSSGLFLDGDFGGAGYVSVRNTNSSSRVVLDGYSTAGGGEISVYDTDGTETVEIIGAESGTEGGQITLRDADGSTTIQLDGDVGGTGGGYLRLYKGDGTATITMQADLNGDGRITTQELQITGGSDLSEQFDINANVAPPQPGMVVCIDPANPGQLLPSTRAYDRTVAGVISGAGGVKPGMLMGQRGTVADGRHPVALTGRVFCLVDAANGAIQPGDLLTTAATPGHAMKVTDHRRAQGAIIGKAMTSLEKGRGLVLVLVSLQ